MPSGTREKEREREYSRRSFARVAGVACPRIIHGRRPFFSRSAGDVILETREGFICACIIPRARPYFSSRVHEKIYILQTPLPVSLSRSFPLISASLSLCLSLSFRRSFPTQVSVASRRLMFERGEEAEARDLTGIFFPGSLLLCGDGRVNRDSSCFTRSA